MSGSQGISRRQVLTIAAGAAGASVTGGVTVSAYRRPRRRPRCRNRLRSIRTLRRGSNAAKIACSLKHHRPAKPWMERLPRKAGARFMRRSQRRENTWIWSDPARARSVNDYYGIAIYKRKARLRAGLLPDLETPRVPQPKVCQWPLRARRADLNVGYPIHDDHRSGT